MIIQGGNSQYSIKGGYFQPNWVDITGFSQNEPAQVVVEVSEIAYDMVDHTHDFVKTNTFNTYNINYTYNGTTPSFSIFTESGALSSNVFTPSDSNKFTIEATVPNRIDRASQETASYSSVENYTYLGGKTGTIRKNIEDAITSRLAIRTDHNMWTTYNVATGGGVGGVGDLTPPTAASFALNPNCIVADLDFSGVPVFNTYSGKYYPGALVSPRDLIQPYHAGAGIGTTFYFYSKSGTLYNRTIASRTKVGTSDILLLKLDSDLPSDIKWFKIPYLTGKIANTRNNVGIANTIGQYIPGLFIGEQAKNVVINDIVLQSMDSESSRITYFQHTSYPSWYKIFISGDSGTSVHLIINGEPTLIGHVRNPSDGPTYACSICVPAINAAMATNGSPYQVTTVDLSMFPNL